MIVRRSQERKCFTANIICDILHMTRDELMMKDHNVNECPDCAHRNSRPSILAVVVAVDEIPDIVLDAAFQFAPFYQFEVFIPLPIFVCL